jgi:hypothetical protein
VESVTFQYKISHTSLAASDVPGQDAFARLRFEKAPTSSKQTGVEKMDLT